MLGLSLGIIAILAAVVFHLIVRRRTTGSVRCGSSGRGKGGRGGLTTGGGGGAGGGGGSNQMPVTMSCSSPTWRTPESESSTGDDRTLHDVDDVELTSFNHIDSLQRRTAGGGVGVASYQPPATVTGGNGRPGSAMAQPLMFGGGPATTTATINRSYTQVNPVATRCFSPPAAVISTTASGGGGSAGPGCTTTALVCNGYGGSPAATSSPAHHPHASRLSSLTIQPPPSMSMPPAPYSPPAYVLSSSIHGGGASYNTMSGGSGVGGGGPVGNGGGGGCRYNMGSLGRTYSTGGGGAGSVGGHHYGGHYQLDADAGSRTLQPMQHYYG